MATRTTSYKDSSERIPFYRNVKTIGILAQIIFAVAVIAGAFIIYRNVATALTRSSLPADFSFLDSRAGIPIAETPIRYNPNDNYLKAFTIGVLNTLKVALVGVLLTSLLGVFIGVMRLSNNWILRQIATVYVETIRNTPLAVQIVFWFTAVLTPLPPRSLNPIELPGGALLSNLGLAIPWTYPSYSFSAWLPWLIVALLLFVLVFGFRRRQILLSERPGNPWLPAFIVALLVAGAGYFIAAGGSSLPTNIASEVRATSGVATVFIDANQNGRKDNDEAIVPFAAAEVSLSQGFLEAQTQELTESRQIIYSTFRFPPIKEKEFAQAQVSFVDPEASQGLSIYFENFPSEGVVYRDLNGNGSFDRGEETNTSGTRVSGYSAKLRLEVTDFKRRIVADRNGQIRIPRFSAEPAAEQESAGANISPAQLFAVPAPSEEALQLEVNIDLKESAPLVMSYPSIPIGPYFGGISLSTNYLALLLALIIYTASFIAEIVRAGIQAVPKGQTEAAKALGLSGYQIFSLIVFPQALRIILPPMISQYLNLTKNSSLAPLAAYAELFAISIIIANQTGASVPVTIMIILAYLIISLTFALVLNIVNARIALVER